MQRSGMVEGCELEKCFPRQILLFIVVCNCDDDDVSWYITFDCQGQLFKLMKRLENTTPHFIRCIKPNNYQSPGSYNQELVLQQLRCCGVLEVVRISRSGFPTRMSHQKFARRYDFLV